MTTEVERQARLRKYAQIAAAHAADTEQAADDERLRRDRAASAPELLALLEQFQASGDVEAFRRGLRMWAPKPGWYAFNGANGHMFVSQLVSMSPDVAVVASLLQRCLAPPASEAAAASAIRELHDYVVTIKKGPQPAPNRAGFLCSFFWSLQDAEHWPALWASTQAGLDKLGWLPKIDDIADRYVAFRRVVLDLGEPDEVELVFRWFERHPFTGLDPSLVDRCALSMAIDQRRRGGDYATEEDRATIEANAQAVRSDLLLLGQAGADRVAEALGRSVRVEAAQPFWAPGVFRPDGWMRWALAHADAPVSLRVWVTHQGVFVGLHADRQDERWIADAWEAIRGLVPPGMQRFVRRQGLPDPTPDPTTPTEFLLGRFHPGDSALDRVSLLDEIEHLAADLQPVVDRLVGPVGPRPGLPDPADPLTPLVAEFRAQTGYPTAKDVAHQAAREEMAARLAADEIGIIDLPTLRSIYGGSRYSSPGPQAGLNVTMRDATPAELDEYLSRLRYLLWDDRDPVERRIDRLLDPADLGIKGLGESVIMKLLAITHPDRILPAFPFSGDNGKARFLKLLGLPVPTAASRGARQMEANDRLRERLEPFFPNDPWGQAQFLYWLGARDTGRGGVDHVDAVERLAAELLVDRAFLDDVIALLRERGQVIFYGPPGTGKTYVARKLAEVLAPDPACRMVVQFHPSTSYEDFFEGYRPEGDAGTLSYRLTKGPLALMAEKAASSPGVTHVMAIDEINRANLPKVFGELLYLLEYRDDEVRTLYRPDDVFSLPGNLLFIGTMNTADRSIALVDAALRRRFHFVPFFPNEGAIDGLLRRWLEANREPTWVADLVDMVNSELVDELGGPDLQLGPSYFMRRGLDQRALERIWAYNIFPLIQDTLFGNPERIEQYRFDRVLARFNQEANVGSVRELEQLTEGEA